MEATTFCVLPSTLEVRSSAIVARRSASADCSAGSAANSGKATIPASIKISIVINGDRFMSDRQSNDDLTRLNDLRRRRVRQAATKGLN
jgi:hypothetical protein